MNVNTVIEEVPLISTFLRRTKDGVQVDVKIHPDVEAFFEKWSGGGKEEVRAGGRTWRSMPGEQPLQAWAFNTAQETLEAIRPATLHALGQPLNNRDYANISYIRLVNASKGISFINEVVMGRQELDLLGDRLKRAQENFYRELIQPMNIDVQLVAAVTRPAAPPVLEVFDA